MAREMFRGGEAAVFLNAAHERRDEFGDAGRVFSEGASVDDRIFRIAVDVGIGRENPGHAHGSGFESRNFSHRVGVFRVARRAHGHGVGKRCPSFDAHGRSPLEIRSNQKRNFRVFLQGVDQDRGRVDLAVCHAKRRALRLDRERADVLFLDIAQKILVVLAFGGCRALRHYWWARSDSNRGPRDSLRPRRFRREWTISSPQWGAGRSSLSLSATCSAQVVSAPSGGVPPAWLRVAISSKLLRFP